MVTIEAGVAEATAEQVGIRRVIAVVRYFFAVNLHPRLGGSNPTISNFMQGRTSRSAVSPDFNFKGGMTASA